MHTDEDYIIAARALRPNLATLLGAAIAQDLEPHLAAILDREITNPTAAADALETLFAQNPEADQQFKRHLADPDCSLRGGGFQHLPGDPSLLPSVEIYGCPEPGCTYTWIRRSRAQRIHHCSTHRQHVLILRPAEPPTDRPVTP
ncbi:MAG: hypothetical protein MH825_02975 [Cyanobacteria bacterium]|nr:hypothetical protein [Cyanobacteriota bacterium]